MWTRIIVRCLFLVSTKVPSIFALMPGKLNQFSELVEVEASGGIMRRESHAASAQTSMEAMANNNLNENLHNEASWNQEINLKRNQCLPCTLDKCENQLQNQECIQCPNKISFDGPTGTWDGEQISVIGVSTGADTNKADLSLEVPIGASEGDMLLLFYGASGGVPDPPSSWTDIGFSSGADRGDINIAARYLVLDSSSIPTTVSVTGRGNKKFATVLVLRGASESGIEWSKDSNFYKGRTKKKDGSFLRDNCRYGETWIPNVKCSNRGVVFGGIMYDDPIAASIDEMTMLSSFKQGDDGMAVGIANAEPGPNGKCRERFAMSDARAGGGSNEAMIAISFEAASGGDNGNGGDDGGDDGNGGDVVCQPVDQWPNVEKNCGSSRECTALVKKAAEYDRICDKYCESFGHVCTRAAEEDDETCDEHEELAEFGCGEEVTGMNAVSTSGMLCTCESYEEVIEKGKCSGSGAGWINQADAEVSSLVACAKLCRDQGNCNYFSYASVISGNTNCKLFAGESCPQGATAPKWNSYRFR
mmetsp:Transcript_13335/g.21913  ORF Transcript_13335/g.21913 Transcript_13335/m.21913 type:complete len:532 (-) Transcript_13335:101-1696(-)